MAVLIPDSCPSKATVGEKTIYALLKDRLSDDFTVWYEPVIAGRYPDFVLMSPTFGLLFLEVKGWYAGQIARASDQEIELHRSDAGEVRVEIHKHPTRQVRDYMFAFDDKLKGGDFVILQHAEGAHRGKPCFPRGFGVLLTNITGTQLEEAELRPLFPPDRAICRDELGLLASGIESYLLWRLKSLFTIHFPFEPLTKDQLDTLKGALHREVIVRRRPATVKSLPEGRPLLPGMTVLDILDAEQEQAARSLGAGHQLVFGVAGSGKTILLLARARLLADRDPTAKILILCYNKALAASLAAKVGDLKNAAARTFHSWAAGLTGQKWRDDESFVAYEDRLVSSLLGGTGHFADSEKYDAILIDEGHDFEPDWFHCVLGMLRHGPDGNLLIVGDGAEPLWSQFVLHLEVGRGPGERSFSPLEPQLPQYEADSRVRLACHPGPLGRGCRVRVAHQGSADQGRTSGEFAFLPGERDGREGA